MIDREKLVEAVHAAERSTRIEVRNGEPIWAVFLMASQANLLVQAAQALMQAADVFDDGSE